MWWGRHTEILRSKRGFFGGLLACYAVVIKAVDWWGRAQILNQATENWPKYLREATMIAVSPAMQLIVLVCGIGLIIWALLRPPTDAELASSRLKQFRWRWPIEPVLESKAERVTTAPISQGAKANDPKPPPPASVYFNGRLIISETPKELVAMYGERTRIQSETLFQHIYYGRPMVLDLKVRDVTNHGDLIWVHAVQADGKIPSVTADFSKASEDQVLGLRKGTMIKVRGELDSVSATTESLNLIDCELL